MSNNTKIITKKPDTYHLYPQMYGVRKLPIVNLENKM